MKTKTLKNHTYEGLGFPINLQRVLFYQKSNKLDRLPVPWKFQSDFSDKTVTISRIPGRIPGVKSNIIDNEISKSSFVPPRP